MEIKLIKINEDERVIFYKINQDEFIIDNKIFKIRKTTANLSNYLNLNNYSLIELLNNSIDCCKCKNCYDLVNRNKFGRNVFITYKYCKNCDNKKTRKKYTVIKCKFCSIEVLYKDSKKLTCGNVLCLDKYKKYVNSRIKETHWSLSENKSEIIHEKIVKRKYNDLKYNRKYIAWNKGKTGIYSKETIEKIRNATINQMKNGRIKKTGIEISFENLLKENNINYIYSFIYNKRQYDFLLKNYNIIIEIQGDYWHANPMFWDVNDDDNSKKKLYETQKMKIKDDIIKKSLIDKSEYDFLLFWEYDINNHMNKVKKTLFDLINTKSIK